ncbi:NAD-dependent epimerase/dehydratase family protein [Acidithiobacillus sp.]
MRVLVTGAAGHTARALLPALLADPGIDRIVALDRHPPILTHPRITPLQADIRDPDLARYLESTDVVIHLAFIVLAQSLGRQRRDRALMRAINVTGSQNLFHAARQAGVRQVVYTSSVAAYGAWPDNPARIPETQPCRPQPGFAYSEDKAAVEQWLDTFTRQHPDLAVTRLRLHAVIGPHGQALVNAIATSSVGLRLPDPDLRIQCIHEEDAVGAILAALHYGQQGIFNIAAPHPIPWQQIPRRLTLPIPIALAHRLHRMVWPFTAVLGDPGWLWGLRYPLVVDTRRAQTELAWQARYDVATAIAQVRAGK